MAPSQLTPGLVARAAAELARRDPGIGRLYARNGAPPLWGRPEGFATLVKIILEQQVSLASAAAAYGRLESALGRVTPERFEQLDDAALRAIGFSGQKAGYCRGVAAGIREGSIVLDDLATLDDAAVSRRLVEIRGVGPWTAAVYLLAALRRPDVWPVGDRALEVAVGGLLGRDSITPAAASLHAERWRPVRSVAARLLWHDYLGGRSPF
jgi:DNA-3-methyladenine glycosylase II